LNSAVGTALLSAGLLTRLLRLLAGSLSLLAGLLRLLARLVALPALLRLALVILIGHLNLSNNGEEQFECASFKPRTAHNTEAP
jgi:hypothetical protein